MITSLSHLVRNVATCQKQLFIFSVFRLVSQLEERVKAVSEEISSLEGVDRRLEELQDKMSRLARQLGGVAVWEQDHASTEEKLAVRFTQLLISASAGDLFDILTVFAVHYFDIFKNDLNPKIRVLMQRVLFYLKQRTDAKFKKLRVCQT